MFHQLSVVIFLSPVFRFKITHDTRNVGSARFNIRPMSGVFSGLLQAKPGEFAEAEKVRRGPGSDGVAGWVLPGRNGERMEFEPRKNGVH
jgi:hypothetical protein